MTETERIAAEPVLFAPDPATQENLALLSGRESHLMEARLLQLTDMAEAAAELSCTLREEGLDIYEILSLLAERMSFPEVSPPEDTLASERGRLQALLQTLPALDRASFAMLYVEQLRGRGVRVEEQSFLPQMPTPEHFVYVHGALADEAYEVFAEPCVDPRVSYVASWQEACRAVAAGECGYCLLPLEERGGVRLPAAAALIFRYDLRISGVTPVFGFGGDADMKYALLSRQCRVPVRGAEDDGYLEIRMRAEDPAALTALLEAARLYGISLYRIHTTVFDTEEGAIPYYSAVFREDGGDLAVLLTYLTLFAGSYTPVGIYKNLE